MRNLFRKMVLVLALATAAVDAAEWEIDPTLRFRTGYSDNLFMNTEDEISSAEATFSPSAVFSVATPTSGASGNVRFDFRRYEEDSNLDDNNSRFEVSTFHNLEQTRLGLDMSFVKDTTLDSQLEATGLALGRIRVQRINISPNWVYNFDELTQLSANFSYSDTEYKNSGGTGFVDFTLNSAQVSLARVLNEQATASITLSRTKSDNDNDVESTNTTLQGGASYRFSETLSTSLFVGVRRTEVDFSQTTLVPIFAGNTIIGFVPLNQNVSTSDWGTTFSATATKTFLRGETGVSASRDISNDINGRPIEVTRLSLTNLYRFTETLSARLKVELYDSKADGNSSSRLNRNYYSVEPEFTWNFKRFWSLSGSYRYTRQTFKDISDDATGNAAYLTLTYGWPRIAVSR